MPRTKISEFSATAGSNTDIDGINISEGCAPSGINDAIRELMAQLKDFQAGTAGDSFNGPVGTTTAAAGAFTSLSASGTFALTGDQVQISEGGTGQATANAAFNALAPSQTSNAGKYLKTDGTNTSWDALDISTADITGTLPVANGGTGVTSSTGTGSVVLSASPTFTGTVNGASLTLSSNFTLSGGTANGVAYLNGSKVLTTGSALTFDGTNLSTGSGSFLANGTTGNTYFRATTTSNYAELQSRPDISYSRLLSSAYLLDIATLANQPILFTVNSSEQMRLTSTGLGIGTSSPAYKLDVNGEIALSNPSLQKLYWNNSGNYLNWIECGGVAGNNFMRFATGNTERMRIDSSGNLGLGVTPSAWWSSTKAIQIGAGGVISGRTDTAARNYFASNAYLNSTPAWTYIATNYATRYEQNDGQHQWFTAPSGTAGDPISFTQALTLDASGNLGIGTTNPAAYAAKAMVVGSASSQNLLTIQDTGTSYGSNKYYQWFINSAGASAGWITHTEAQGIGIGSDSALLLYSGGATERARITSAGDFIQTANTTAPTLSTNGTVGIQRVSDTELKILMRGSDGVTRSVTLTLA